jgi:hypothetical protein
MQNADSIKLVSQHPILNISLSCDIVSNQLGLRFLLV